MLTKRVIACLDVRNGRVVKGVRFSELRDAGDPAELASRYQDEGADEIVFLDISATPDGQNTLLREVEKTANRLFIPLVVGGGVRSVEDIARALRAGADKVAINSAAVRTPCIIEEGSGQFGAQCIVASIDARVDRTDGEYRVWINGGRTQTDLNAVSWARRCVELGAGEILLTSIDRDGEKSGYDLALLAAVGACATVPVIASGGAGAPEHLINAISSGCADAVLVAGILHEGLYTVRELKQAIARAGIRVRDTWSTKEAA